jgi:cystathionine gamma-synthase
VVCGAPELVQRVYHFREINGASLSPSAAFLLLRGMKTLKLRVQQQSQSAMRIARFLDEHPKVDRVFYPGLPSHARHEVARAQMRSFGGMLAFSVEGGFDAVVEVLQRLQIAHLAASLGAVETLAAPPATSSHVECSAEERAALGIPESLVRYSVGIEDTEDLIADLGAALEAL